MAQSPPADTSKAVRRLTSWILVALAVVALGWCGRSLGRLQDTSRKIAATEPLMSVALAPNVAKAQAVLSD
jgi:hypothetical protein